MCDSEEHGPFTRNDEILMDQTIPTVFAANMTFLFSVIVLFVVEVFLASNKIKIDIIGLPTFSMEVLFFLLPPIIYMAVRRGRITQAFRVNSISYKNAFLVVALMLSSLPIIGMVNYIIYITINTFGTPLPNPIPEVNSWIDLVLGLIIISITPAFCEEIMARGLIMRAYERFGTRNMIMVSAVLFSVLHRNVQSLIPIFVMGLVLGYVTYRTNSIFAGIIAHFTNNAFAVLVTFGAVKLQEYTGVPIDETEQAVLSSPTLIELTFAIPIVVLAGVIFIKLLKLLNNNTKRIVEAQRDVAHRRYIKPILMYEGLTQYKEQTTFYQYIPLIVGLAIIGIEFGVQIVHIISG